MIYIRILIYYIDLVDRRPRYNYRSYRYVTVIDGTVPVRYPAEPSTAGIYEQIQLRNSELSDRNRIRIN